MTVKTLKMGNTDGLCRLQIKLLHFLAAAPQSIKRIRQHLAVTEDFARSLIQPLISDQFITKQGNGQYRNFIKKADIPALPAILVEYGGAQYSCSAEEVAACAAINEQICSGTLADTGRRVEVENPDTFNGYVGLRIWHMVPGEIKELLPLPKLVEISVAPAEILGASLKPQSLLPVSESESLIFKGFTDKSEFDSSCLKIWENQENMIAWPVFGLSFSEWQSLVYKGFLEDYRLTATELFSEIPNSEKPVAASPTPESREADFKYLARIYSDEWFKQADLVGLHAGSVVKQMASVWPDHKYFGVTPLFTQEELLAKRQVNGFKAPISFRRISADLDFLANQYTENWFEENDLVGVLSLRVVHALSSDFPSREYYGQYPLFDENDILARRIQLGLQQVPCTSCEKPMTPEEVRYSAQICSRCESLNLVKPHASSEPNQELAAALAELALLKTKLARCHELGQLVASADAKLQYLTGLRLFVKYAAPKGEQYLDEIMADYQQLQSHSDLFAGYGGDK